jgi:hypothetical protein
MEIVSRSGAARKIVLHFEDAKAAIVDSGVVEIASS